MSFFEYFTLFLAVVALLAGAIVVGIICGKCVSTIINFFDNKEENNNGE